MYMCETTGSYNKSRVHVHQIPFRPGSGSRIFVGVSWVGRRRGDRRGRSTTTPRKIGLRTRPDRYWCKISRPLYSARGHRCLYNTAKRRGLGAGTMAKLCLEHKTKIKNSVDYPPNLDRNRPKTSKPRAKMAVPALPGTPGGRGVRKTYELPLNTTRYTRGRPPARCRRTPTHH